VLASVVIFAGIYYYYYYYVCLTAFFQDSLGKPAPGRYFTNEIPMYVFVIETGLSNCTRAVITGCVTAAKP